MRRNPTRKDTGTVVAMIAALVAIVLLFIVITGLITVAGYMLIDEYIGHTYALIFAATVTAIALLKLLAVVLAVLAARD